MVYPSYIQTPYPGISFFCTGRLGHLNRAGGSGWRVFPCQGEQFSAPAEWDDAVPTAVGKKRKDNLRFSFLFELCLSRPLDSLAQTRDRRPLRRGGTTEDFFFRVFSTCSQGPDTVLLHRSATSIRRGMTTVPRNANTLAHRGNRFGRTPLTGLLRSCRATSTQLLRGAVRVPLGIGAKKNAEETLCVFS